MAKKRSEYGQGFIYNMVLFAKHYEQAFEHKKNWEIIRKINPTLFKEGTAYGIWFNGAADHLFEWELPKKFERTRIGAMFRSLQSRASSYRLEQCSEIEFKKFWEDFENLTRMIDKALGVKSQKADWN